MCSEGQVHPDVTWSATDPPEVRAVTLYSASLGPGSVPEQEFHPLVMFISVRNSVDGRILKQAIVNPFMCYVSAHPFLP